MSTQHVQYVTIFSIGGKFQAVSNFTKLHTLLLYLPLFFLRTLDTYL